jgi:hypothetical protein
VAKVVRVLIGKWFKRNKKKIGLNEIKKIVGFEDREDMLYQIVIKAHPPTHQFEKFMREFSEISRHYKSRFIVTTEDYEIKGLPSSALVLTKEDLIWISGTIEIEIINMKEYIKKKGAVGWEKEHIKLLKILKKKIDRKIEEIDKNEK